MSDDSERLSGIVAFLSARLDEDELAAKIAAVDDAWDLLRRMIPPEPGPLKRNNRLLAAFNPARVLREVEAKRNIIARYEDCLTRQEDQDYPHAPAAEQAREYEDFVLPNLAARYSDHPDYDEDWKP